jgi:hypothetical protein
MKFIVRLTVYSILYGAMTLAVAQNLHAGEMKAASARNHGLTISIVNDSGRFVAGNNAFCVVFTSTANAEPVLVKDVDVEFAQQVGRIQEKPMRAQIARGDTGRFCGKVDLGTQYYQPAFYYVFIHYTDANGKRRNCRLSLSVKARESQQRFDQIPTSFKARQEM